MAKKPLKSQLNQIRAWAREGRTDAWIAHQLDVSAGELRGFRKRHGLDADEEGGYEEDDLRDAIEAEIEAAALAEPEDEDEDEDEDEEEPTGDDTSDDASDDDDTEAAGPDDDDKPRRGRRRRRRRGGGGARRPGVGMEASFDHGEQDGYGVWLDPAVADDPVYAEHWKGHAAVEVTIEPDRIVVRRSS